MFEIKSTKETIIELKKNGNSEFPLFLLMCHYFSFSKAPLKNWVDQKTIIIHHTSMFCGVSSICQGTRKLEE